MTQEFDVPLRDDGALPLPEQVRGALDLAVGQPVRFLLHTDGVVELVNPRPVVTAAVDPDWLVPVRRGDPVVPLLAQGIPSEVLQVVGLAVLRAIEQQEPGVTQVALEAADLLEERGWPGDPELADLLRDRAAGRDRGRPCVPADLEMVAGVLDHDPPTWVGGRLNLADGMAVPEEILELDEVLGEQVEQGDWVPIPSEGSRAAWRDMEVFAEAQERSLRRRVLAAIEGRGAFRRFRDLIFDQPEQVGLAWSQFRAERAAGRALEWLVGEGYDLV